MATKVKKPKATEPAKPNPENLIIDGRYLKEVDKERYRGASEAEIAAFKEELSARAMSEPMVRAAAIIQKYEGDSLNINALVNELREQVSEVSGGNMRRPEAMLVAQAHTLEAIFCNLARRSHTNSLAGYLDAAERYLRLALKAQAQAVRTIEALGELKNPRPVAFVRQANIANGPQQINNGTAAPSPAREIEIQQNKLSGDGHELLPHAGASTLTSRVDTEMETLGEVDRTKDK